ncbi:MAG: adenylate kinase, partial [Candidatus Nanohaloarchaea archaeon]
MSEVNIITGLSGVGKSTVLEEALKLADEEYKLINYGDRMLQTAKDEGIVNSRDELKDLGAAKQKEVQKKAAKSIVADSEESNVIVDTHAAIKTPQGYLPGLPRWTIENLDPEKIIMIDASAEEIYSRSTSDTDRDREHNSPEEIAEYKEIAKKMAAAGSVLTGAYFQIIENPDKGAEQAAEELIKALR